MIEWHVIEQRDQVAWSGKNGSSPEQGRPGLINYLIAGITLVATGVIAFFAFSFLLLVIVPLLLIGGIIMAWKWRRVLKAHQERFRQTSSTSRPERSQRPFAGENQEDVIDI